MSHDLHANNKELEPFHMAGSWAYLLEQSGAYFTCMVRGKYYTLFDERMTTHFHATGESDQREQITDHYPAILCNCGFEVTEEEAHVLARIARNFAAIQRTLDKPTEEEQDRQFGMLDDLKPFPRYIRRDWVEQYEQFANWAEESQGFKVF